jgi:hypothetical protein
MKNIALLAAVAALGILAPGSANAAGWFQGFETDTAGWVGAARVASGTDGIPSAHGSFHGKASVFTYNFWGGAINASTIAPNGYRTSVAVYLDVNGGFANDTRWEWTSAVFKPDGNHRRDFIFNGGFYNDTDASPGSGTNRFIFSASNNCGRSGAFPKNPGRSPIAIATTGWYTFEHHFYDNGGGILAVDLRILNSTGAIIQTWTLSDASDVVGVTAEGNGYGWFCNNEFSFLAIDDATRKDFLPCAFLTAGATMTLLGNCVTDETISVPDGFTLDGDGYSITAVDPPSPGHFVGAVVRNAGDVAHVTNLTVTASGLANVCDDGADRLRGIMFEGASGSITNNIVADVNQGPSGCQEGNAIDARNEPFDNTGTADKLVLISGNTVSGYIKNGITANGSVAATITNNTVVGAGPVGVPLAAQNGIQIGFGGTATIEGNTVTGNNYTPKSFVSCGILYVEADGVRASRNFVNDNERNFCNFGKGGGQFNPVP